MQTVCFGRKIFYTEGLIKNKGGFSVGAQTGVGVWTSQRDISSTGNMTTNRTITATGAISGGTITSTGYLAVTGTSGRPTVPTVQGCFIGSQKGGHIAIELTSATGGLSYTDLNQPKADFFLKKKDV